MAIEFIEGNASQGDLGDVNFANTLQENDIVVCVSAADQSELHDFQLEVFHGYTVLQSLSDPHGAVAYKFMGSSPDISFPDLGLGCFAFHVYRGVDTVAPLDAAYASSSGATGMPDAPISTSLTDGAQRVIIGALDDDNASGSVTMPTGYTNLQAASGGAGSPSTVMIAGAAAPTAGANDPAAFGGTGNDQWRAAHIILRPAVDPASAQGAAMVIGL
ncbi:hypothetical protein [Pelagibius sp.]|uniref:hypothetical protein n=1 Tax=Pelagibius sp. TaxID=1931238 RepID=UPI003BB1B433